MASPEKTLEKVLRGTSDANVAFTDLVRLLNRLGFTQRVRGSHHIYTKPGVEEILNLQPKGSKAKPYQVKQVRHVILRYKLAESFDAKI
jgi:HicA toxin of bacterial toxin-antitoxin,